MAEFDSQLTGMVVSSTKVAQRAAQTPAVVTVINAEEIQARGYTSIAEVLRSVPGFFDVYDLATHNMGVRGVNGGTRASGNVLKVMIDGQPVDFRPDTGNFFGEELIPIQAVERVEIIRGPASALYGANAFLGVVNVITRRAEDVHGVHVFGHGVMVRANPGGGGGLMLAGGEGPVQVMLAGSGFYVDRSGLGLPDSSPALTKVVWPLPPVPYPERGLSVRDYNRPNSLFGKLTLQEVAGGTVSLLASVQKLDSVAEFQDYGTLYHGTRLSLVNQNYRLGYDRELSEKVSLSASANFFTGGPGPDERIDLHDATSILLRRVGVTGFGFAADARIEASDRLNLTFGADVVQERHLLQTFDQRLTTDITGQDGAVLRSEGTVIPGQASGAKETFLNVGAYGQAIYSFNDDFSATAGARVDRHNIYGLNPSGRVGLVYAPMGRPLSAKLLYGSSFKAPSAVQLYTQPMGLGDVRGNAELKAQTAHTVELAGGYVLPNQLGEVSLNVFGTDIYGRVAFLQNGSLFLQAFNLPFERIVGGEVDARLRLAAPFQLRVAAGVARTVARDAGSFLAGLPEVYNPLFPAFQVHLTGDYFLPWWGLRLSAEASLIGPRSSSQSNAAVRSSAYELPPYLYTAASVSTAGRRLFGDRETSLALRVSNLLDQRWAEPGAGGVDLPALGRTATLTVVQSL